MKLCKKCNQSKNVDQFSKHSKRGLQNWCKECLSEYNKNSSVMKAYNEAHKEEKAAYSRRYHSEHKEEINKKAIIRSWIYRQENPEKVKESKKQYRIVHKESYLKTSTEVRNKLRFNGLREIVFAKYGNKCGDCGMTREEHKAKWNVDLTINHIDGMGRNSQYQNNNLDNLEALCIRCHTSKDSLRLVRGFIKKWI